MNVQWHWKAATDVRNNSSRRYMEGCDDGFAWVEDFPSLRSFSGGTKENFTDLSDNAFCAVSGLCLEQTGNSTKGGESSRWEPSIGVNADKSPIIGS